MFTGGACTMSTPWCLARPQLLLRTLLVSLLGLRRGSAQNNVTLGPTGCAAGARLNPASLACSACPADQVVSPDGAGCVCAPGTVLSGNVATRLDPGIHAPRQCTQCEPGRVVSDDGLFCLAQLPAAETQGCLTRSRTFTGERVGTEVCEPCGSDSSGWRFFPDNAGGKCVPCADPLMTR